MAIINGTAASEGLVDASADLSSTLNANWSSGDDTMFGGINNDIYNVNSAGDLVVENVAQGYDTVVSRVNSYTLTSNVEALTLSDLALTLTLPSGQVITLPPVAVNGTGNALDNTITGNRNANTLSGLDGNDNLSGLDGNDTLLGGNGNDYLNGGNGNDVLDGGAGNDSLVGGAGSDAMTGGLGNDLYVIDAVGDTVVEAVGGGVDTVLSSISDTLDAEVDNLTFYDVATALWGTGNALGNVITGNSFGNTLSGLGGNDVLNGLGGVDTLLGGNGLDTVNGGDGNDYLYGQADNDTLNGGNDADYLDGGAGADVLRGDAGNDTLNGTTGNDTLSGGTGQDRFVFSSFGAANGDFIADFSHVDDTIVLSNALDSALAGAVSPGVLGLSFVGGNVPGNQLSAAWFFKGAGQTGNGAFSPSGIYLNSTTGDLWYNPTNAGADAVVLGTINLAAVAATDATDFVYGA